MWRNWTAAWQAKDDLGVELLHAEYSNQQFAKHTHNFYSVGLIVEGAARCWVAGSYEEAGTSELILVNPGDVHMGATMPGVPWRYRSFLISPEAMRLAAEACQCEHTPLFPARHSNPEARRALLKAHTASEAGDILEAQTSLRVGLMHLVLKSSNGRAVAREEAQNPEAVKRVEEFVQEHYSENIGLPDLAYAACMSQFHLVRVFSRSTGLTPHQYVTQVRVDRAKAKIQQGAALSLVATECGFVDQSHMTKWFKRILGYTPGAFVPV